MKRREEAAREMERARLQAEADAIAAEAAEKARREAEARDATDARSPERESGKSSELGEIFGFLFDSMLISLIFMFNFFHLLLQLIV